MTDGAGYQPDLPVLTQVRPVQYTGQDVAAYQAAINVLDSAVDCFTHLISREQAKTKPDWQAIAHWRAASAWCTRERRDLRPSDRVQVTRAHRQWDAFVRRSRQELREA